MELSQPLWATLNGGYKIPFDASIPLKKLEATTDPGIIDRLFAELWDNLHHQGDLGLASYFSVPYLINICIKRESLDWNYVGLCLLIENTRTLNSNPKLPQEFEQQYFDSLTRFELYLLTNIKKIKDKETLQLTLGLVATVNGLRDLGLVIEKLDDDLTKEFLDQF